MTTTHPSPFVEGSCNLRFADDINLMGGSNGELQDLTSRLVDRAKACGMEVSTEKSKIMTNSTNIITANISMNGQKLEEVISFKCLGATLCMDGTCLAEICIRIASAMAVVARLGGSGSATPSILQTSSSCTSLVMSILLYGCKTWTLLADLGGEKKGKKRKKTQAFKTTCLGKLVCIFYLEHKTTDWVWSKIKFLVGPQEPLLATVKRRKLTWPYACVCACVCVCVCVVYFLSQITVCNWIISEHVCGKNT